MAENCAGCGHSHDLSGGRFGPTLACWEPPFGSCKCPGYRTRGQLDALARIEELEKEMRAAATVVGAAAALERCPECDIKALDCGHAEELHDALAALGGEDG